MNKLDIQVNLTFFCFMLSEIYNYMQSVSDSVVQFDKRYHEVRFTKNYRLYEFGEIVGQKFFDLWLCKTKTFKKEMKNINLVYQLYTDYWKTITGDQAISLEKSSASNPECKVNRLLYFL